MKYIPFFQSTRLRPCLYASWAACFIIFCLTTGCRSRAESSHKDSSAGKEAAARTDSTAKADPDQITITAAQERAAGLELGTFTRQNMSTDVLANGMVDVPPQNRVSITAVMGGYVQSVAVLPGQHLAKGATVAVLRHPDYLKLQQDYLQSRAKVAFLLKDLQRQQVLNAEDVGAKRKLQQAQADYQTEQAALQALTAQVRMLGLSVERLNSGRIASSVPLTTPIGGYVKTVNINPGQYVNPQDVLVEVVDRSDLHLELKVFEKDIARVHKGQRILFKIPNSGATDEMTARVFLVGKAFDDNAHTVSVHAHLDPERNDLLPGQYVSAHIQTGTERQRTLPEEAVIQAGELSYIYERTAANNKGATFRRIKVKPGTSGSGGDMTVAPLEPIADTTHLVRRGAYFLNAELSKGQGSDE